jgi:hypothetical protein
VRRERRAGDLAEARQDVDHARGTPASSRSSPSRSARQRGLVGRLEHDGAARREGPSFQAAISSGKFQGMIWPTTPTGSRSV